MDGILGPGGVLETERPVLESAELALVRDDPAAAVASGKPSKGE